MKRKREKMLKWALEKCDHLQLNMGSIISKYRYIYIYIYIYIYVYKLLLCSRLA